LPLLTVLGLLALLALLALLPLLSLLATLTLLSLLRLTIQLLHPLLLRFETAPHVAHALGSVLCSISLRRLADGRLRFAQLAIQLVEAGRNHCLGVPIEPALTQHPRRVARRFGNLTI